MLRTIALLALLPLAGCVESPVPLESGEKVSDPDLLGDWKTDLMGDPMVATIRLDDKGQLVADVQAYWEPGPKAATKHFRMVLARFGEHRFMSLSEPDLAPSYALSRYVFEGKDRWCLHTAPTEATAADLGKTLPGEIKPDRHMPHVALSATPEQLRAYFATQGAKFFDDHPVMAFERVPAAVLPLPRTQEERDRDAPGMKEVTPCRAE